MFYNLILNMWVAGTITETQVLSKVPKYISQAQADAILLTPQDPSINDPLSISVTE